MHAVSLTAAEYLFSLFMHASVCCHYDSGCFLFVASDLRGGGLRCARVFFFSACDRMRSRDRPAFPFERALMHTTHPACVHTRLLASHTKLSVFGFVLPHQTRFGETLP